MFLVTAMTFFYLYTDLPVEFPVPQCRRMVSSGIVEVVMELSKRAI